MKCCVSLLSKDFFIGYYMDRSRTSGSTHTQQSIAINVFCAPSITTLIFRTFGFVYIYSSCHQFYLKGYCLSILRHSALIFIAAKRIHYVTTIPDCVVCMQTCHHPVRLQCGHIFCFLCLKGVAARSHRCALCRAEVPDTYFENPIVVRNYLLI